MTTPGVIYKDLLIVGSSLAENATAAPGHIRAYDVRTGKRRWIFHTIPQPGEYGYETWKIKKHGNISVLPITEWYEPR
jgi:quinoprotein glucose dehydrogenase